MSFNSDKTYNIMKLLKWIKGLWKRLFGKPEKSPEHVHQPDCGCELRIWDKQEYEDSEKEIAKLGMRSKSAVGIKNIALAFHVIHKGEPIGTGTNISDAQILSAIRELNKYCSVELNTKASGTGNNLRFILQNKDDQGNPTTGIYRFNGAAASSTYAEHGIRSNNQKQGESESVVKSWSRQNNQQVYNVWVVSEIDGNNGGSGVQGFAYYPTTALVDGTVQLYNATGKRPDGYVLDLANTFNLKTYTDESMTLPHEIGHGFGIRHTFDNYSCLADSPHLHSMNIMSYSGEHLKTSFAPCQTERIGLVSNATRNNLSNNSPALDNLSTLEVDATLEIINPKIVQCSSLNRFITVKVTNTSTNPIHKIKFEYSYNDIQGAYTWWGPISPQSSVGHDVISIAKVPITESGNCIVKIVSMNDIPADITAEAITIIPKTKAHRVEIKQDILMGQMSWYISNATTGEKYYESPPYPNFKAQQIVSQDVCLPNGTYIFTATDIAPGFNTPGAYIRLLDGDGKILVDLHETFSTEHFLFTVGNKSADINKDGHVNLLDISLISAAFGSVKGDANYNPDADLNNDGKINLQDLSIASEQFNKEKDSP